MFVMIIIAVFNPTPETSPLIMEGGVCHKGCYNRGFSNMLNQVGGYYIHYIYGEARINVPPHAGCFTTHTTTHTNEH